MNSLGHALEQLTLPLKRLLGSLMMSDVEINITGTDDLPVAINIRSSVEQCGNYPAIASDQIAFLGGKFMFKGTLVSTTQQVTPRLNAIKIS
jgi:hypothetical protein